MATANLRFRVNGGSLQSGTDDTVGAEDTISLTATSFAGWTSPAARWEILTYPDGFACPTGWSTDATTNAYYYLASTIDGVTPPDFDLPTALEIDAGQWGKWRFRLTVNGTVVSDICGVEIISANGVHDLAVGEEAEFGGVHRAWVGPQQENLRLFDNALTGGASVDAVYLLGVADGALTNAVVWTSITTTVAFASTATIPCSFTRTSSTTNAAVDAMEVAAVCSATAVNGFGVSTLYKAATKDAGRIKFTFADITGASEDSAFTVQLRTGGAALSDAIVLSGTGLTVAALAGAGGTLVVDSAGTFSVGGAFAPADAAFLTVGAVSGLSAEVDVTAIGTTVEFTSTSTLPFGAKRTSATTNAIVDVQRNTILTTGTAATNFGGGELWQAEDASGSAADIGRTGFYWSDAAALSAESAWIVQLRLAGDGLQTKLMLEGDGRLTVADLTLSSLNTGYLYATSGVVAIGATQPAAGDAVYLENASTAVNSNGVPIQALPSTLYFQSTTAPPIGAVYTPASTDSVETVFTARRLSSGTAAVGLGTGIALGGQDADGDEPTFAYIEAVATDVTAGAHAANLNLYASTGGGGLVLGLTLDSGGNATSPGAVTAGTGGFVGVSIGRATTGTFTVGGAATTVAVGVPLVVSSTIKARNFGTGTSVFANVSGETTTAATLGTPVQNGCVVASAGTAYDTDDAVSRVVQAGWYCVPSSGATVGYTARLVKDAGAGSWSSAGLEFAGNSVVAGNVPALVVENTVLVDRVVTPARETTSASNLMTFDLLVAQDQHHDLTEDTVVTIANPVAGQSGHFVFVQDATGRTVTMPSPSASLEYIDTIETLTMTGIVDTNASAKTLLLYIVLPGPKVFVYYRATSYT